MEKVKYLAFEGETRRVRGNPKTSPAQKLINGGKKICKRRNGLRAIHHERLRSYVNIVSAK